MLDRLLTLPLTCRWSIQELFWPPMVEGLGPGDDEEEEPDEDDGGEIDLGEGD